MFKRCFGLLILCVLLSTGMVSAQDGGSTLAAWADTPASAFNVSQQVEWPSYQLTFTQIHTYTPSDNTEPAASCVPGQSYTLWHTFIPAQSGPLKIELTGSNFSTFLAVYKTSPTVSNEIECWTTASIGTLDGPTVNVRAGTRYYVMFAAFSIGDSVNTASTMTMRYSSNSILDRAFQIPRSGVYSNVQDQIEQASGTFYPTPGCPDRNFNVYYKFRPSVSGRYEVSTQGSNYDTVVALYDPSIGVSDSSLAGQIVSCHNDISVENANSRLRVNLTAGSTYFFIIGQAIDSRLPMNDNMTLSLRVRKL